MHSCNRVRLCYAYAGRLRVRGNKQMPGGTGFHRCVHFSYGILVMAYWHISYCRRNWLPPVCAWDYARTRACTHPCMRAPMRVCMHACKHMHPHMSTCMHVCALCHRKRAQIRVDSNPCVYLCACACVCACANRCVYGRACLLRV